MERYAEQAEAFRRYGQNPITGKKE